jgi:diketogulonate reductase-like aldo/keto reductase
MRKSAGVSRRAVLKTTAALGVGLSSPVFAIETMQSRVIPRSDEALPVIGLGTYNVFDVAGTEEEIATRLAIVEALIDAGGSVIDTSPMYNRSEQIIGQVLNRGQLHSRCFLATKVWTNGRRSGEEQMRRSAQLMGSEQIDLMQVHNRRDLATHWPVIREMQQDGFIRYNGVTDYRASSIDDMMEIMRRYQPEIIQINYSLGERDADARLLPLAQELGIAVLVNRPFVAGRLFRAVGDRPVPEWAAAYVDSWGQFFLKFIVSHPAVTCVIPATSKLRHQVDNAGAGTGEMPDASTRQRMTRFIESI